PHTPAEPADGLLGEEFAGRARDERAGTDLEPEVAELGPAEDVWVRLAAGAALNQLVKASLRARRHLFLGLRRAAEHQLEELAGLIALIAGPAQVLFRPEDLLA